MTFDELIKQGPFRCIVADPPWPQGVTGRYKIRPNRSKQLPYHTMALKEIMALPVKNLAADGCHLWLWTTNGFLGASFDVVKQWGFKYLAPIHWIKPSGLGNYFIHKTQTILFGYHKRCEFPLRRYAPNIITSTCPKRHSEKPEESYSLIESVSPGPRLELFARRKRDGWVCWGDEI